jgi:kumamolisin
MRGKRRSRPVVVPSPSSDESYSLSPDATLDVTFHLVPQERARRRPGSAADIVELSERVSREELAVSRRKALKQPVAEIRRFAKNNGMSITEESPDLCRVKLRARVADAERLFRSPLQVVELEGRQYRCPRKRCHVPSPLRGKVRAVLGLDQRPRLRRLRSLAAGIGTSGLLPTEIARLYGLETARQGAGQCVAIIEPNGGYDRADLATACHAMNLPMPDVVDVNVGQGRNDLGRNPLADREVSLDVQVVAGVAPRARIVVFFTTNTEMGLADGVVEAVRSTTFRPDVVVITWGEPEAFWPDDARKVFDDALADAAKLGVTVVAAVGDDLATERMPSGVHVDYPASSPYVLACGGTRISLDPAATIITDEVVWNDGLRGTGGGISDVYQVPDYQRSIALPPSLNDGKRRRGVPDVAAAASETNGYRIVHGGAEIVTGGTSAVAPLWGAFIALINAQRGRPLGFINPELYRNPVLLREITSGNNMALGLGYRAGPGWNACTGLGVPDGRALAAALTALA